MKILIVEDNQPLAHRIQEGLELKHYSCQICCTCSQAFCEIEKPYDAYLIDLNLPDGDGYSLVRQLKAQTTGPVFIISSNCQESSIIQGYSLDIEEYIEKPVRLPVLLAKLESVFRRNGKLSSQVVCQEGIFDMEKLSVQLEGQVYDLTPTHMAILQTLMKNPDRFIARDRLKAAIFSATGKSITEQALSVRISELKNRLQKHGSRIRSRRNTGYLWESQKEASDAES